MPKAVAKSYFHMDIPPPDLGNLDDAYHLCARLSENGQLPNWHVLPFRELTGWHDRIMLSKVLPDHSDMQVMIVGEAVRSLFADDLQKGTYLSKFSDVPPNIQSQHIANIVKKKNMALCYCPVHIENRPELEVYALDAPLFPDPDGTEYVLSFFAFSTPADWFQPSWSYP